MKKTFYILLLLSGLIIISPLMGFLNAQTESPNPSELLTKYIQSVPLEKYLINTDRDIYFINENIWFNIWSIDEVTNIPVSRSRAVYLELIGKDNIPLVQQSLIAENKVASGKILIPYTLSSGTYYLRAYSNWQKNFGPEFFGIKIIQIINPYDASSVRTTPGDKIITTCFPEGGSIIQGINNKVLIVARNENGNYSGIDRIKVTDKTDSLFIPVNKTGKGFGIFNLKPESGHEYFIISDTSSLPQPLKVYEEGLNISVMQKSESLFVNIEGRYKRTDEVFYLVIKNSGDIFFQKNFSFNNTPEQFEFPVKNVPEGLTDITVLDSKNKIISQRLYYRPPEQSNISLKIIPAKTTFSVRDSVKILLSSPDYNRINVLSMSVRRKGLMLPSVQVPLESDISLHSNINDWDDFKQLELDDSLDITIDFINNYLISKSLNRLNWNRISTDQSSEIDFLPEFNTKYITGTATDPFTNNPLVNQKLIMYFVSQVPYILMSETDEQGRFSFSEPIKRISKQEVLVQSQKPLEGLSIRFDWPYYEKYCPYNLSMFYFDSLYYRFLDEAFVTWQVNMIHRDRLESLLTKAPYDEISSLYGPPDRRFYLRDYIQFNDMQEVFKEIVDRVRVQRKDSKFVVNVMDNEYNKPIGDNPLLLFNGHQIEDISTVLDIPVQNINFVDVIAEKFFIGDSKYDGVVNVVPNDILVKAEVPKGSFRYVFELFNDEFNFVTRDYGLEKDNPVPDFRNTLYWNPDIKLNQSSEDIIFFSGDDKGEFELELRGIGTAGEIIFEKSTIVIK